jgi:hypothetical protein
MAGELLSSKSERTPARQGGKPGQRKAQPDGQGRQAQTQSKEGKNSTDLAIRGVTGDGSGRDSLSHPQNEHGRPRSQPGKRNPKPGKTQPGKTKPEQQALGKKRQKPKPKPKPNPNPNPERQTAQIKIAGQAVQRTLFDPERAGTL